MIENASKREGFTSMKQGDLLKKLRKERNLSQKSLSQGLSSRSTLSSFENRNTHLSSELLFNYLDRLNITPNEFQLLLNEGDSTKKQKYSAEYHYRHYEQTLTSEFLELLQTEYKQTNDVFYLLLYLQGYLENARQAGDFDSDLFKKHAKMAQDYLFRIETWGKFEFSFFINLLFVFEESILQHHIESILNKIMVHSDDYLYSNIISIALLNGCHYAAIKRNKSLLQEFLQKIIDLPDSIHYFYLKSHQAFYQMIYTYLLTKEIDMDKMNKQLEVFKQIGYQTHGERLRLIIDKLITPN